MVKQRITTKQKIARKKNIAIARKMKKYNVSRGTATRMYKTDQWAKSAAKKGSKLKISAARFGVVSLCARAWT